MEQIWWSFLFFDRVYFVSSVYTLTLLMDSTKDEHICRPQNLSHTLSLFVYFILFLFITIIYLFFKAHLVNVFGLIYFGFFFLAQPLKPIIHTHLGRLNLGPSFSSNLHIPFQTLNLIISPFLFLHQPSHPFFSFLFSLNSIILFLPLTFPNTFLFPFIFFLFFYFSFLLSFFPFHPSSPPPISYRPTHILISSFSFLFPPLSPLLPLLHTHSLLYNCIFSL